MIKLNAKNNYFKNALKITAGLLVLFNLGQLFLVSLAQAANPRFNTFTPYTCTWAYNRDYYLICVKNDTKGTDWNTSVLADAGDTLSFSVYYHNGVNGTFATNTKLRVNIPSGSRTSHTVSAYLWADNAENATAGNPLTFSNTVNVSSSQSLEYIQNSAKWFPDQRSPLTDSPVLFPFGQTGNEITGNGVNVGDIEGCWEFSGMVNFKVKVGEIIQNKDLSISKTVKNITTGQTNFSESTNANQNDRVKFQIQIENTGNAILNNVIVRDSLPSGLSYVSNTLIINGNSGYSSSNFFGSGVNINSLNTNDDILVTFEADVNSNLAQTLTNQAYARADQVAEKSDSAQIFISQQTGSLSIVKYVRNLSDQYQTGLFVSTINAKPGDRVKFTIQISVTNNSVNNIRAWDVLPSGLTYVSGTLQLDNSSASDAFFSSGINLGTLFSGQTKTITFEANVNSNINNQNLTNYAYAAGDGTGQVQASAQVIISQAVIISSPLSKTVENTTWPNGTLTDNSAHVGEVLRYTLTYQNQNNTALSNVQIFDVLPSYTTFVSAENNGSYNSATNQITWNIGSLAYGATATVSYRVKVLNVPQNYTIISNTALLRASGIKDVVSNETRTAVILPTIPPSPQPPIKVITGVDSMTRNFLYSLGISMMFCLMLYFGLKYADVLRLLKLRFVILKIKARETL